MFNKFSELRFTGSDYCEALMSNLMCYICAPDQANWYTNNKVQSNFVLSLFLQFCMYCKFLAPFLAYVGGQTLSGSAKCMTQSLRFHDNSFVISYTQVYTLCCQSSYFIPDHLLVIMHCIWYSAILAPFKSPGAYYLFQV